MGPLSRGEQNQDPPDQVLLDSPASKNSYKTYLERWPPKTPRINIECCRQVE